MSEDTNAAPSVDQLRQEAAGWFAMMRGPEAEERRDDFTRWLATSAAHRRAYNSISEKFNLGKGLKNQLEIRTSRPPLSSTAQPGSRSPKLVWGKRAALAGIIAALCSAGGWYEMKQATMPVPSEPLRVAREDREARFATTIGEIRNFVLLDGSKLTLDTNSIVLASYTQEERGLRLIQGRARFSVAQEARPFVVRADTTVVTARGTSFDIRLEEDRSVAVHALTGQIDVQTQSDSGTAEPAASQATDALLTRLATGQRLLVDGRQVSMAIKSMENDDQWPEGVEAFNDIALSDLVASLNRYAQKPVVITDARVGAMRVSGTYRLLETSSVVTKIADLLGLAATEDAKQYRLHLL